MSELGTILLEDLSPFADLGTEPPRSSEINNTTVVRFVRNGNQLTLTFFSDGRVLEKSDATERTHLTLRALLASNTFADLGRWADSQRVLLREQVKKETIPIIGTIAGSDLGGDVRFLDDYLEEPWAEFPKPRSVIVLIDGPAGIGKTSLIRSLAFRRSDDYRLKQRSLILHVESRGRMLQNITDLMAFSLQTLRVPVTYDQIPVLIRHSLITLAVDGFDELGDPNGYELAWAQVNELVQTSRGGGTLLFAGRETFISKDRIISALNAIDPSLDKVEGFTLKLLSPTSARHWLAEHGWMEEVLNSASVQAIFEEGSYALRPFFLSILHEQGLQEQILNGEIVELLSFLMGSMIRRESEKFGRDTEAITTSIQRETFIRRLMEEVARDLAENQAGSIQIETLAWLAEIVADGLVPRELSGILKNRSGVLAFLTEDDRRGYKKFIHEYVYYYFLSLVTVSSIIQGELAKFIRRNILGVDFLEVFSNACRNLSGSEADGLIEKTLRLLNSVGDQDRARGNLTSLVLSACSVVTPTIVPLIANVSVDEAYLGETVSHVHLKGTIIGQLNARGADFRAVAFDPDCVIVSLVADEGTVPSLTLPLPSILALPDKTIYSPDEIGRWLRRQAMAFGVMPMVSLDELLRRFEPFALLARIARYKPYWLKDGDERAARRILDDPHWGLLKRLLQKHDLITERQDIPAAGRPAPFYHVKNRMALKDLEEPPNTLLPFMRELFAESLAIERSAEE